MKLLKRAIRSQSINLPHPHPHHVKGILLLFAAATTAGENKTNKAAAAAGVSCRCVSYNCWYDYNTAHVDSRMI